MLEKIGNVTIDTSQWPGEEKYSDGPIEQELLQRLQAGETEAEILQKDNRYAMLYHLTRERENILSWYPFTKDMRVLEIGAGCGAITGLLSRACGEVTSVDISLTRSRINAYRHREATNLHLLVANAEELSEEPRYDIVTLIGVFEYAALFVQKKEPFRFFLEHYRKMLKPDGHLLIAIENQFGLKYLLGAREDHHWKMNEGLYDYPSGGARTFSHRDLDHLLLEAGFEVRQFAAVYPDYKIPYQIISENIPESMQCEFSSQPDYGEFVFYSGNVQRVMQAAERHGLGIELANSFFVCAGSETVELPYYVKYASSRKSSFAVRTELYHDGAVRKVPLCSDSAIGKMLLKGKRLLDTALSSVHIANIHQAEDILLIEKAHGVNLTKLLEQKDQDGKKRLFSAYMQLCHSLLTQNTPIEFTNDESFKAVFGEITSPAMICVKPAPIDLNLGNIIDDHGHWTIIDTEWVFEFAVPYKYILWRAAFLYSEATGSPNDDFISMAEITDEDMKVFRQMEKSFNQYAFGRTSPMAYNQNFYSKDRRSKDCQELITLLNTNETLLKTINKEKETAWQQFTERQAQYDHELSQRLQAEEANRQLKADNEELARQLDASNVDRATAWKEFSEREAQYNRELSHRLQAEEASRQLRTANEELSRQLDASNVDRATAWQQFSDRETKYNQELSLRLQIEENNRQLSVQNEEMTRRLEISDADRLAAWESFKNSEKRLNEAGQRQVEQERQIALLKGKLEDTTRLANQYRRHLNEVTTKLDELEKSLLVRAVEKVKKI